MKKAYTISFYFLALLFLWLFVFSLSDPLAGWSYRIFTLVATIAFIIEIVKRHKQKNESKIIDN